MRIVVKLVDISGETTTYLTQGNDYLVLGIGPSGGFYVINDIGKIHKASSDLEASNT